jgi:hypothetical protein
MKSSFSSSQIREIRGIRGSIGFGCGYAAPWQAFRIA